MQTGFTSSERQESSPILCCTVFHRNRGVQTPFEGTPQPIRWQHGCSVGSGRLSQRQPQSQHSDEGPALAQSIQRRPALNRWSAEKLSALKVTPWSQRGVPDIAAQLHDPTAHAPKRVETAPPSFTDLQTHGFTENHWNFTMILLGF